MIAQVATALVFFAGERVGPSVAAATLAAVKERMSLRGVAPIDLTAEHRALTTRTPFVDFTAPPPAFLPPELADPWKRGNEACAKQVGPLDAHPSPSLRASIARDASFCKQSIGLAMWDLFLKARKVTRVMSVDMGMNRGSDTDSVGIAVWWQELDGSGRVSTVKEVSADQVAAAVTKAVDDLLGGGGGGKVPPSSHPMPSLGVPELEAASFGRPEPVKVPASCTGLPARLEVFPLGKVTRALEAAYQTVPEDRRTGKPLRCDLVLYPDTDVNKAPIARARLACPPHQIFGWAPVGQGPKLIATLANYAVANLCTPAGAQ